VYRTVPPVLDGVSRTLPLRLARVVHREFPDGTRVTDDPVLHRYYADLAALHGLGHRPDALAGTGNTFAALAGGVLTGLLSPAEPVDLVVIANSLPDLDPRVSSGVSLTATLPGSPLVFGISGPDASIGFTALRVAGDYVRRHSYRRVVVLVLGQTVMPYETTAVPGTDAAVALLLADAPGSEVTIGHVADVPGALTRVACGADVVVADPADPGTGVWAGLTPGTDAVLAVHDHARGALRYCAIREP
jgi:hypothetical protein